MKNVREDVPILDALVGNKLLSYAEAQELARLPLLVLPEPPDEAEDIPEEECILLLNQEEHILQDFVVLDGPTSKRLYYRVGIENGSINKVVSSVGSIAVLRSEVCTEKDRLTLNNLGLTVHKASATEEKINHVAGLTISTLLFILKFLNDCHNQDKYAVKVEPPKPKTASTRRQQLNKVSGPSIIFLNKLPQPSGRSTAAEEPTGTKAPHHRRGHFKTLRDERYANHPKYLVERGIYVKPAWIGDRQSIVNGTTYTVLEK